MMDYKVLYRKYRPTRFDEMVGQKFTVEMLKNAVINNKIAHAYIFTGPRGTGKTSSAKIFAKTINCLSPVDGEACGKCSNCLSFSNSPDIIEIDAASNNGVDDIRELINNVKIAPTEGKYKVYIIDEVHMMTQSAFNALLLTLEEPPSHAVFIMATTNIESVPITILSRCQRFNFTKISLDDLCNQLKFVCKNENISIDDDAILEIASLSEGGMRDALSLLDQLSSTNTKITTDLIVANYGSISYSFINNVIEALDSSNLTSLHEYFSQLSTSGADYKIFMKKFIDSLVGSFNNNKFKRLTYSQVKSIVFEFNSIFNEININVNPFMLLELILINNLAHDVTPHADESINILNTAKSDDLVNSKIQDNDNLSVSSSFSSHDDVSSVQVSDDFVKLRINNCFYGAKKSILNDIKQIWNDIRDSSRLSDEVISYVSDTDVVASSSSYAILVTDLDSTKHIINENLKILEDEVKSYFDEVMHFIVLSKNEWLNVKKEYVTNIKNGYIYKFIPENIEDDINTTQNDEILETNIFESDKIEIV